MTQNVTQDGRITAAWKKFEQEVMSPLAPPQQRREMQLAFFFGSLSTLYGTAEWIPEEATEDEGAEILEAAAQECRAFIEQYRV